MKENLMPRTCKIAQSGHTVQNPQWICENFGVSPLWNRQRTASSVNGARGFIICPPLDKLEIIKDNKRYVQANRVASTDNLSSRGIY